MKKQKKFHISLLFLGMLLITACGLSPEEIATQTASAWTSTPVPPTSTPTPTPVPYDLTISVEDSGGNRISNAAIIFPESGDDEPMNTSDNGDLSWANLQGEHANFEVNAQGYYGQGVSETLVRGNNEITFTLERDPFQLLPSEVCQSGQEVLYIEDFEDGFAQGIEGLGRPAWVFESDPELGTVLVAVENTGEKGFTIFDDNYENIVFHFDIVRPMDVEIIWIRIRQDNANSYIGVLHAEGRNAFLQREDEDGGAGSPWPGRNTSRPDGMTWEHISLSAYEGLFDLWINNELLIGVTDPEPYGSGNVSFYMMDHTTPALIDNLVICGLTEPYDPPSLVED